MLIGNKVKQLRKQKDMSLTELSEKSGVQLATLSRIENQKMTGTLECHMAVAQALGVDLVQLYQDADRETGKVQVKGGKATTDTFTHNEKSAYEILTSNVLSKKMMPVLVKIEPGGATSEEKNAAGSEKFLFVLDGKISVSVGSESFSLSKNNALYFDAGLAHKIRNQGKTTARVISVVTPAEL